MTNLQDPTQGSVPLTTVWISYAEPAYVRECHRPDAIYVVGHNLARRISHEEWPLLIVR